MTGFRNLFNYGKFTCFRSINIGINQSFNNDNRYINKFIRQFRSTRNQIKSGVQNQLPLPNLNGFPDMKPPNLKNAWKPILFSFAFSSGSLAAAAIWQYENTRTRAKAYFKNPAHWLESQMNNYPKKGTWRQEINRWWNRLSEGEKIFLPILIANMLVYIAWQVPRLQLTMLTYFCSNPSAKAVCWPLVLSTFSHYSLIHLLANMYVLHSFCEGAVASLGKEQFVGLYMVAGCLSSLTSYLYKSAIGVPGLSLGASGAIMAIIGYICTAYPNTELSIIFLPFIHFKADLAIKALMALDTAGLIFRWQFFDHAAHLGGAAVGILWCSFGNTYIWQNRKYVVQVWHDLRSSFEK